MPQDTFDDKSTLIGAARQQAITYPDNQMS